MVAIDAGTIVEARRRPKGVVQDLKSLRTAVVTGQCRIGPQQSDSLPCLLGLIMELLPYSEQRDRMIDAIAQQIPGNGMARSQMRMMRYCRSADTTRRSVLRIIDAAIVRSSTSLAELGPRLALKRLILKIA